MQRSSPSYGVRASTSATSRSEPDGGDARAREAFDQLARALGEMTAPWLESFGATCLVVGGSISQAWDLIEAPLTPCSAGSTPSSKIAPAARVDDAALLGAARHAAATVAARSRSEHGDERAQAPELTVGEARRDQAAEPRRGRSTLAS